MMCINVSPVEQLRSSGFPAYTTSAGWMGYSDETIEQVRHLDVAAVICMCT